MNDELWKDAFEPLRCKSKHKSPSDSWKQRGQTVIGQGGVGGVMIGLREEGKGRRRWGTPFEAGRV